ncbi:T6SS phospholipase effector Tle1-like catalytic domain-containing protein [Caballeronia sp.]|jgi:hypothetical protein|uniref:T6SS phospholipase effector Tle1-like catalytic domain-containing protein n=1 Tax=Caballeronia sp. TaxID=1931223 RepID=UPI003C674542
MTVRHAPAPATDGDLSQAAWEGKSRRIYSEVKRRPEKRFLCTLFPKITFFFDGTGNNAYQELEKPISEQALSNVAKLFRVAVNDPSGQGATPIYIPGVGTPFRIPRRADGYTDLLRDDNGGPRGLGLGAGGDMRIEYAISEFCRILEQDWSEGALNHMPYINLAVFGFSRGATEARAFVRRLIEKKCQRTDEGLCWIAAMSFKRVPLRITFMGLFDTVASVGGPSLHLDWASELAIPPEVERCVHYVAAHEVRQAFPLDSVRVARSYPENCEEVVYPGVHSDVGGGYALEQQGRSNLLSRIPLRHMYAEALRAEVPLWEPEKVQEDIRQDYALPDDDPVSSLYQSYMAALPALGDDVESLIQTHRRLQFQWRGALHRNGEDERVLGMLYGNVGMSACREAPVATELDHPPCAPTEWTYAVPANPEKQALQLLGEQRRLAVRVAFLRNPVEGLRRNHDWPSSQPRKRTPYEDLILSAWDNHAVIPLPVDTFLAEYVHDSVAHFSSWPCALYDTRGVYCDRAKYYAQYRTRGNESPAAA